MGTRITRESMELIAKEIMDTACVSACLEDGINMIREILEGNGIIEVILD